MKIIKSSKKSPGGVATQLFSLVLISPETRVNNSRNSVDGRLRDNMKIFLHDGDNHDVDIITKIPLLLVMRIPG